MSVRLATGARVEVRRRKRGRPDVAYPLTVDGDDGDHVRLHGPFSESTPRDLGYVRLEPTDIFHEHFWRTRWYTVAEIVDAAGRRKGWYCDLARPALIGASGIDSVDLEFDVWVPADGGPTLLLDADDFASLDLERTDPRAHEQAMAAIAQIATLTPARLSRLTLGEESHARRS